MRTDSKTPLEMEVDWGGEESNPNGVSRNGMGEDSHSNGPGTDSFDP